MKLLPFEYAVRNLSRSPLRMVATLFGCALVVLVLIAAAAFVQGMRRSFSTAPNNRNVMLIGTGSEESLERSQFSTSVTSHAQAAIQGIRKRLGTTYISPEVHVALIGSRPGKKEELRVLLRGVTEKALLVHQTAQIVKGRFPRSGYNELLVGRLTASKLEILETDLAIGKTLILEGQEWTVTGHFQAPGTVMDGEIWTALTDLQVATQRDTLSTVIMTLEDAEFADVEAWATIRLDLELSALRESDYYSSLRRYYQPIQIMIAVTAFLISLAGILGGFNTLYAAFAVRMREIGMLQTLGFSRVAIVINLVQESLLAAIAGALIGCGLGRLLLHGHAISISMGIFSLQVDSLTIMVGIGCGILLGIAGTLPPAIRCMRLSIAESLKA
ncbi:MAG: ABC transporter permease [Planctomycetota bacterium]|jgi:putative ABC transport system permease protein